MAALPGAAATAAQWRAAPASLQIIHRQPITGCPFDLRLDTELARAASNLPVGMVDAENFDDD